MKCKKCGAELRTGLKTCPYCGAVVVPDRKAARSEFKWNVQDFPKPKKKEDLNISWASERAASKEKKTAFGGKSNPWQEPAPAPKAAAGRERSKEKKQELLDRQLGESPARDRKAARELKFDFPSSGPDRRGMRAEDGDDAKRKISVSDDFLSWGEENKSKNKEKPAQKKNTSISFADLDKMVKKVEPSESGVKVRTRKAPQSDAAAGEKSIDPAEWQAPDIGGISGNDGFEFAKPDLGDISAERTAAVGRKTPADEEKEKTVFDEFNDLLKTKGESEKGLEDFSFMSDEEVRKAEEIEDRAKDLRAKPQFTFDSIENEYDRYCEENGIARNKGNKEVQIKINEPSGTKVTVRTQEINLAQANGGKEIKTREVDLDKLREGPKNVQVSVEVNAAKGNASVEVTRRHDGATVVKTVDDGKENEHTFIEEEQPVKETAAEQPEKAEDVQAPAGEAYPAEEFWEHPANEATRMTITDIFGPEARKIIEKFDKARSDSRAAKRAETRKAIDDSMMLDINPDDIVLSDEQTRELMLSSDEDFIDDIPDIDLSGENEDDSADEFYPDVSEQEAEGGENNVAEAEEPAGEDAAGDQEEAAAGVTEEAAAGQEAAGITPETAEGLTAGDAVMAEAAADAGIAAAAKILDSEADDTEAPAEEETAAVSDEAADVADESSDTEETEQTDIPEQPEEAAVAADEAVPETEAGMPSGPASETAEEPSATAPETVAEEAVEEPAETEPETVAAEQSAEPETAVSQTPAENVLRETSGGLSESEEKTGTDIAEEPAESSADDSVAEGRETAGQQTAEPEEAAAAAAVTETEAAAGDSIPAQAEPQKEAKPGIFRKKMQLNMGDYTAEAIVDAPELNQEIHSSQKAAAQVSVPEATESEAAAPEVEKKQKQKKAPAEDGEQQGFSNPVKAIIIILIVLLVLEFSVIGIKVLAPGSQPDVFIQRVETQIAGLVSGS